MTQNSQKGIEVEIKYELESKLEYDAAIQKLQDSGFEMLYSGIVEDVFTKLEESDLGGWDFTRYRVFKATGQIVETIKSWGKSETGEDKRSEIERSVTADEFADLQKEIITSLIKYRISMSKIIENKEVHVDADVFYIPEGFAEKDRYFLEVERVVYKDEDMKPTKEKLKEFAKDALGLTNPAKVGMVDLALKYQKQ